MGTATTTGRGPVPFNEFFRRAVGNDPFPFQAEFAKVLPALVDVPTGLGKTAMAVIGWLWRRFAAGDEVRRQTPRRLVYCLPMRVLVEQTRDNTIRWLHNLGVLGGRVTLNPQRGAGEFAGPECSVEDYSPNSDKPDTVAVYVLMGGEDEGGWDTYPEREAIIIGTQDMLLSRALNRGYAASRSRWPMQFGLLHTDCLWVFDEIQLMGAGLATSAQLEAFRQLLGTQDGHGCRSVWMSATLRPEWLKTVDFASHVGNLARLSLTTSDLNHGQVRQRYCAQKPLAKARGTIDKVADLAREILDAHKPGTRTIVIVNTVRRARELVETLQRSVGEWAQGSKGKRRTRSKSVCQLAPPDSPPTPSVVLLHSRYRPIDRKRRVEEALADIAPRGVIIVSTQVIEATGAASGTDRRRCGGSRYPTSGRHHTRQPT
jgi:CRISPR-associated endonuclease/helicase Cas3